MKIKTILPLALAVVLAFSLTACKATPPKATEQAAQTEQATQPEQTAQANQTEPVKVKIGIVGESENDIWKPVIEQLAPGGIEIETVNFADYILPNTALRDGDIDLNAFQTYTYMNKEIANKGFDFVGIGDTYIAAMCIYSNKIKDVSELAKGDKIAIPNDETNLGRALSVAQGAGIIKLNTPVGEINQISNISENPLEIEFVQIDAATIPSLLPDVAAGIINGNYALDFGLSPANDSIFFDDVSLYPDNRYVNNIAARGQDVDNETYKKIVKAYQSEAVKKVFIEKFEGSYIPAWKSSTAQ